MCALAVNQLKYMSNVQKYKNKKNEKFDFNRNNNKNKQKVV